MQRWLPVLVVLTLHESVSSQAPPVPPLGQEYDEKSPDGSYRFGFQTGDAGGHYRAEVGSKDNQVVGRFGARDSAKGRVVETTYTAGRRGFRARGPNIARQQDLSQNKIPYNPPVSPSSPNYRPTYDGYNDPNEDPSYKFSFKTPTHTRSEISDSSAHIEGVYSYLDDVGERHDVRYEAGPRIGFNVKSPFPDSKPYSGLFYKGPPGKGGQPRGRSSIYQQLDGSYRFIANAPDHRRAEVSDRLGNVRGSYTFIDDKGQQRTVEYIAGPNIGYKVIRKGTGPNFPPSPPFAPPNSYFPPFSPNLEGTDSNNFLGGSPGKDDGTGGSLFGEGGTTSTSKPGFGQGPQGGFGSGSNDLFGDLTTPSYGDSSTTSTPGYDNGLFGTTPPGGLFVTTPSTTFRPPTSTTYPTVSPPGSTTDLFGNNDQRPGGGNKPFQGYPSGRPQGGGISLIPPDLPNNCCKPRPPITQRPTTNPPYDDLFLASPTFNDDSQFSSVELLKPFSQYQEPRKVYPRNRYQDLDSYQPLKYKQAGNAAPVRAHVQSVDLLPFGSRLPSPGEALERGITYDKVR